jgi:hypothetical protein
MSQTTATARVPARPGTRPAQRRAPSQPLQVLPGRAGEPGNGLFAALCLFLLVGGLVTVLMLNTSIAQGAFTVHDLQRTSAELTETEQALTQAIEAQQAPAQLATRAARLGMVPADSVAFLRLSDGAVLGVARPATKPRGFSVVTAPTTRAGDGSRQGGAVASKGAAAGPRTVVAKKGDVVTTTVVTSKPDGSTVTTVTSVNVRTKVTSSRTLTTRPPLAPARTGEDKG